MHLRSLTLTWLLALGTSALLPAPAMGAGSESHGAPNGGRLDGGVRLPQSGPGFLRRARGSQFGTQETIALVQLLGARLTEAYPDTAPLLIGDISRDGGGPLRPHRSHQSGRDVDIAFPERVNTQRRTFNPRLSAEHIDLEKTWFAFETLINTGRVRYIFVDGRLLAPLRREAERSGWGDEALRRLFVDEARPRGRGLVRPAPGHMSHFHVRFHCPLDDAGCLD